MPTNFLKMPKNLEEHLKKEMSIEDFKKIKFRDKLKLYAYDWACNILGWPAIGGPIAAFANLYFAKDNKGSICNSIDSYFVSTAFYFFAGAAVVSALRTAYRISRDYRMIKKGK